MEVTRLLWLETAEIGKIKQLQAVVKTKAGISKNIEIRAVSMSKSQQFITYEDITQRLDVEKIRALHTSIVESSDDAIVGKDLEGIVISWNKGAEKVYGYTAGEMVGQSIYRIIPQQYHDEFREMLTKIEHGEIVEDHEGTRIRKDGAVIDISLTLSPIHSEEGKIIGASAIARDITRQKQDEKELLIKKFAMDSSINGIAIADLDKKITYANQTFLRMFGYASFAEIAGMPVNTFTHGDEREQQTYEEIYKSLEKKGGWVGETQPKKKDGTHFDAQLSASIVKNTAGEPLCCMATLVDITIRKRAEYESFLKENAIAATMNAIVILDLAGNVIYANRAFIEIMGYSSLEDVIYHPIEYFCHGNESILAEIQKFQEESKHKNKWKSEVRIIDRNGKITQTELTMFQVANSANRMVYIILSFVDITEKKALEQKINNTDRELSAVIEFLPDAISIVDTSGRITAWNRAMEEFSGIKKEDIIGHPVNPNALPALSNPGPPLVDLLDLPPDTLTQQYPGVTKIGQSLVREVEDPRGDASKSRKYLEKVAYLHDNDGNVTGTIMNIRDVTALKIFEQSLHKAHGLSGSLAQTRIDETNVEIEQLKQELHRQKERIADYSGIVTAMNASTDMILVLDNANKITRYNTAMAAQFGHSFEEEVLGKHISSILAPEYRKIVLDYIADAEHETSKPIRYSLITHEGRITVEASVSIIRDHSGDPEGFIIIQRPREKTKSKT